MLFQLRDMYVHVHKNMLHFKILIMKNKTSLIRDCHQFDHYQQSKQSHFILTELTEHKNNDHVRNPGPGLGQAHTCGGVKPINGICISLQMIA